MGHLRDSVGDQDRTIDGGYIVGCGSGKRGDRQRRSIYGRITGGVASEDVVRGAGRGGAPSLAPGGACPSPKTLGEGRGQPSGVHATALAWQWGDFDPVRQSVVRGGSRDDPPRARKPTEQSAKADFAPLLQRIHSPATARARSPANRTDASAAVREGGLGAFVAPGFNPNPAIGDRYRLLRGLRGHLDADFRCEVRDSAVPQPVATVCGAILRLQRRKLISSRLTRPKLRNSRRLSGRP